MKCAEKQFDKIRNVAAPVDFMNSKTMKPIDSIYGIMYLRLVNILEKYWKNLVVDTNDISKLVTAEKSSKSCCEEEKNNSS